MTQASSHQPESLLILADDREAASPVPEILRKIPGVEVSLQRLPVGDYELKHRCVFERKTMPDFAASIVDGRLFTQAQRLARLELPAVIILEGRGRQLAEVNVRREALQGAMISLGLIFHLPVLRSLDANETAHLLVYSARQLQRQEWTSGIRYGRRPKQRRRLQLQILQALPGIGPAKAQLLLERFGSVQAVMAAALETLQQVEGIGPKIAAGIRYVLNEAPHTYGNPPSPSLPP